MRKSWKKTILIFGAVCIALLMISSATAVPQVNGKIVVKTINKVEKIKKSLFEEKQLLREGGREEKFLSDLNLDRLLSKIENHLNSDRISDFILKHLSPSEKDFVNDILKRLKHGFDLKSLSNIGAKYYPSINFTKLGRLLIFLGALCIFVPFPGHYSLGLSLLLVGAVLLLIVVPGLDLDRVDMSSLQDKIKNILTEEKLRKISEKVKQVLNGNQSKDVVSKMESYIKQKLGENFLKNLDMKSFKEKIKQLSLTLSSKDSSEEPCCIELYICWLIIYAIFAIVCRPIFLVGRWLFVIPNLILFIIGVVLTPVALALALLSGPLAGFSFLVWLYLVIMRLVKALYYLHPLVGIAVFIFVLWFFWQMDFHFWPV